MSEAASTCPKCGQPRPPAAVECPFCGVIYSRAHGRREASLPAPEPPPAGEPEMEPAPHWSPPPPPLAPGGLDDVYQGPSIEDVMAARPQPPPPGTARGGVAAPRPGESSAGPVVETETVFTRNLWPSIFVAGVLLLLVQAFVQASVLGAGQDREAADQALFLLAGIEAPDELSEARELTFVGHHFLMFGSQQPPPGSFPTLLVLYHREALANGSKASLAGLTREKLEALEIPWHKIANRSLILNDQPAVAEVLGIGEPGRSTMHLAAAAFEASDGRPSLLLLFGVPQEVERLLRGLQ